MPNKTDLVRSYLPSTVDEVMTVQIDLDTSGLGIADVIRNLNIAYPKTSRERERMKAGKLAVGILCKSELLEPAKGIFLVIGSSDLEIKGISRSYILFTINEADISDEDDIAMIIERMGVYLAKTYVNDIPKLREFYNKCVYDEYEQEARAKELARKYNYHPN